MIVERGPERRANSGGRSAFSNPPTLEHLPSRQFRRTRFVCKRCGTVGRVTEGDPATDPDYQGFEMDHGAIEAEQRQHEKPAPPPPTWLLPTDPRLETAHLRLAPVYAEIDHRHFLLIAWIETAWLTLHDGRPIEGTITRWRYWEGDDGARKALGL